MSSLKIHGVKKERMVVRTGNYSYDNMHRVYGNSVFFILKETRFFILITLQFLTKQLGHCSQYCSIVLNLATVTGVRLRVVFNIYAFSELTKPRHLNLGSINRRNVCVLLQS